MSTHRIPRNIQSLPTSDILEKKKKESYECLDEVQQDVTER